MSNHIIKTRAQVPEALILLVALVICGYSFYAVYSFENNNFEKVLIPNDLIKIYEVQDYFEFYALQSSKLSINNAFSSVFNQNLGCKVLADKMAPIWSHNCNLFIEKLNNDFVGGISTQLKSLINNKKFKIILRKKINIQFEESIDNFSSENYHGEYRYSTNFLLDNPIYNFDKVYKKILLKNDDCIGRTNSSIDDCRICMNTLSLNDFEISCKNENEDYLLCYMKTKKDYFYNNSFNPIEFKFAVSC